MWRTLQSRLLLFGIICFLLTASSSAIQLVQFRDIARASDQRQVTYDRALDDSARLREEVIRLIARIKDVWLRGGKTDDIDTVAGLVEQPWQTVSDVRAKLETDLDLTPAMRVPLQQYDQSIAEYRGNYLQTLAQFRIAVGQADAANADTRADATLKGQGLVASDSIGGFQDAVHTATASVRADQRASINTARNVTLIETGVLLAFVALAGLRFVRTTGRGVGDVARAAAAFGRGARDVFVPIRGAGEVAQLGHAFNVMVKELGRQEQQLEELRRIAVALTSATTEQEVCEIVVNRLSETFGYHYVSIYLIRPDDPDNLHLTCQRGYTTVIDPIPVPGTVTGRAVRERRPILVRDSGQDSDFIAAEHQIVCEACAPILTPDRVLGAVLLEEERVAHLSETDLNLITTLANNISVALENVRLTIEADMRIASLASANRDLAAVTATGTRLAATLNLDAVCALVADELGRIVDAPSLYVASYTEGAPDVTMRVAISGGEQISIATVPLNRSLSGWVIRHHMPILLVTGADVDDFLNRSGITITGARPQSLLAVPLIVGSSVVGAVSLGSPLPHAYTEQQVAVVQTIAAQAAIAVNNALLYDQVEQQVREMQRLNAELAGANALKSEFLATMSHELRTPLNAIIGFSELLSDGIVTEADEINACLRDILSSGRHLLSLINDVLDISKIEAGRMELTRTIFDLRDEMRAVGRTVAPLIAARKHRLLSDEPPEAIPVFADRQRVRQIILNLVSNAIKFTPDGGVITMRSASAPAEPGMFALAVQDTGIGIKEEDFPKLFEKFRQLDSSHTRRYEGTGLGLALTKQLVELNGGALRVTSTFGRGSTFTFTVPAASEASLTPDMCAAIPM
ncbi:MAG: GAF domain-containing protein [Chloroflexota bacterium]|nr:GAF domain-containing protein [Chloroflexota bacterium]